MTTSGPRLVDLWPFEHGKFSCPPSSVAADWWKNTIAMELGVVDSDCPIHIVRCSTEESCIKSNRQVYQFNLTNS